MSINLPFKERTKTLGSTSSLVKFVADLSTLFLKKPKWEKPGKKRERLVTVKKHLNTRQKNQNKGIKRNEVGARGGT